ncbi:hydroxyacylglutathione hydrolase [Methylotuvimicrobium buryatense]|uniref:Hydroxyacylglutathione hydrolase n=1 Tax=Methylotuvimicrobium buryatense TaxID=95641 RepID=A0A4P9UL07_METBY|nr:hydroxyacylglutathione hydrolase [Methylotuvimicrobium buryatense]QCW81858.1 hydroxyacylglutathione hydrolase [Methylotuvimicrobium buryatense]
MLTVIQIPVLNDNYIYLAKDVASGLTAAVDPAVAGPVLDAIAEQGWRLDFILNTHHHGDHVGGNRELKKQTGCQIVGAKADKHRIPGIDIELSDGGHFRLGNSVFQIIETPGHTLGHIVYYSAEDGILFCGDTLFAMGCGRLFEGTAEQMWHSLQKLRALPSVTRVYCAHEYTLNNGRFALTVEPDNTVLHQRMAEVRRMRESDQPTVPFSIEEEVATNPFFRADVEALKAAIAMETRQPLAVFTELRSRKDVF